MTHSFPTRRSADLQVGTDAGARRDPVVQRDHPPVFLLDPGHGPGEGVAQARDDLEERQIRIAQPRTDQMPVAGRVRSEEHTSELQSLMRNSYAVFCLQKTKKIDK